MYKSFIAVADGRVAANWGQADGSQIDPEFSKLYNDIREVATAAAIRLGFPTSCYNPDWTLKSPKEIKAQGYDHEGNPLPTVEELAAKAEAEEAKAQRKKEEEERQREEAEKQVASSIFGDTPDAVFKMKRQRLNNDIIKSADMKQKAAYRAVLLHNIPDPERWEISDEQIKRYEVKLAIAQDDSDNSLSEKEKQKVIAAYEASEQHLRPLIVLIDACRRVLQKAANKATTEEELGNIRAQMKAAEEFHTQTPKNELDNWAKALGGWREAT